MVRVSKKTDKDDLLVRLGAEVRAKRTVIGLSQEAFADAAGIERSHMGKIERGERNVSFLNIVRIANALGTSPSKLMQDAGL
ncbi:helix-turn-helix transcriptional regulator [Parasphingorhabdus sp.]|uniref:helix-turn-helix domain-containing protein n=1 Tax=Parasphingorhabdus sp. TaxID=2709688 RepID=UPI002F94B63C